MLQCCNLASNKAQTVRVLRAQVVRLGLVHLKSSSMENLDIRNGIDDRKDIDAENQVDDSKRRPRQLISIAMPLKSVEGSVKRFALCGKWE